MTMGVAMKMKKHITSSRWRWRTLVHQKRLIVPLWVSLGLVSFGLQGSELNEASDSTAASVSESSEWGEESWGDEAWSENAWSDNDSWGDASQPPSINFSGFSELLIGVRPQDNSAISDDMTAGEIRAQLAADRYVGDYFLSGKLDAVGDAVLEHVDVQVRELYLSGPLSEKVDFKIGRQVSTWGTGDLLFLNDLFPKDWEAFFFGSRSFVFKKSIECAEVRFFSGDCQY